MPTTGATWTFNEDGTATVNGKKGNWTESNGFIEITEETHQTANWTVSDDGKRLSLSHPDSTTGRPGYTAEFERQ